MSRLPPMPKEEGVLLVNEFFYSIQGESTQAGRPCFFVRLTGCHLRCGYCDTAYAFFEGTRFGVDEVLAEVRAAGCRLVQITGGEPLLQPAVYALMDRLLAADHEVMVETSGSLDASRVPSGVRRIFDVKTPESGEAAANRWENFKPEALREGDEVKFVIASRRDYEWARDVVRQRFSETTVPLLFSPVWETLHGRDLASWVLADALPVRVQVQLHKVMWGEKRGV